MTRQAGGHVLGNKGRRYPRAPISRWAGGGPMNGHQVPEYRADFLFVAPATWPRPRHLPQGNVIARPCERRPRKRPARRHRELARIRRRRR